jgi:hypothetical protein
MSNQAVCVLVASLCVLDVILYRLGGSDWTISRAILRVVRAFPAVGMGVAYTLAALAVHLVAPEFGPDPTTWTATLGTVVGLIPIGLSILALGLPVTGRPDLLRPWLDRHGRWAWLVLVFGALALGGLAGAFLFPQHPYAG